MLVQFNSPALHVEVGSRTTTNLKVPGWHGVGTLLGGTVYKAVLCVDMIFSCHYAEASTANRNGKNFLLPIANWNICCCHIWKLLKSMIFCAVSVDPLSLWGKSFFRARWSVDHSMHSLYFRYLWWWGYKSYSCELDNSPDSGFFWWYWKYVFITRFHYISE